MPFLHVAGELQARGFKRADSLEVLEGEDERVELRPADVPDCFFVGSELSVKSR